MIFVISTVGFPMLMPCVFAAIPIMVVMQLPNAVASKSVGENVSPLPLLSTGASVNKMLLDLTCVASVLRSPRYFDLIVGLFILIQLNFALNVVHLFVISIGLKNIILILLISLSVAVSAQTDGYSFSGDESNPEIYGGLVFHSNGWGVNVTKSTALKNDRRFLLSADLVTLKHPKEEKRFNQNFDNTKKYVYGKMNYFMTLRPSVGYQNVVFEKGAERGVQVSTKTNVGGSIGLARPVYLIISKPGVSDGSSRESEEPYNPEEHQPDRILGRASYFKGFNQSQIYPGVFVKTSLNFEYSSNEAVVRAIETGVAIDYFFKQVPLMAFTHNQSWFLTAFISVNIGKRQS